MEESSYVVCFFFTPTGRHRLDVFYLSLIPRLTSLPIEMSNSKGCMIIGANRQLPNSMLATSVGVEQLPWCPSLIYQPHTVLIGLSVTPFSTFFKAFLS